MRSQALRAERTIRMPFAAAARRGLQHYGVAYGFRSRRGLFDRPERGRSPGHYGRAGRLGGEARAGLRPHHLHRRSRRADED